jgi:membrane protein involved in colicin uptake
LSVCQTQIDEGDRAENPALSVESSQIQTLQARQARFAAKTNRHFMALHETTRQMRKALNELKGEEPSKERLKQLTFQLQIKAAEAKTRAAEASAKRSEASTAKSKAVEASAEAAKAESEQKILQLRNEHLDKSAEEKGAAEKLAKDTMDAARVAAGTRRQGNGTDRAATRAQGSSAAPQAAEADFMVYCNRVIQYMTSRWVGQRKGGPGDLRSKGSHGCKETWEAKDARETTEILHPKENKKKKQAKGARGTLQAEEARETKETKQANRVRR